MWCLQVRSISVVYSFDSDAKLQLHWHLQIYDNLI
jgi:hypothetical protein